MMFLSLLGIDFYDGTMDSALDEVFDFLDSGISDKRTIFTPNPEMLVEASNSPGFDALLRSAWLKFPDGVGILWAYRFLHNKVLSSRITGTDFLKVFLERNREHKVFLLGAEDGVAEKLSSMFPVSQIVGVSSVQSDVASESSIVDHVNRSGAKVIFVAFGSPAQEYWLQRNMDRLANVRLGMGVGGAFDFITGKQKRAPEFMRSIGLEWLWRLFHQPQRLGRIFKATVVFPYIVVKSKLRNE